MYKIGDHVVYGIHGVCTVAELEKRILDKKEVTYLVLEPIGQEHSRYLVPTHNALAMSKLRNILSRRELEVLLSPEQIHGEGWISDENQRKQVYRELINSGDPEKLTKMLRALYLHREEQTALGKRCHICDENFLRDAQKQIAGELSVVMGLTMEEAIQYLQKRIKEDA